MASASLMTETVRGKTQAEAKALGESFRTLAMTGNCPECDAALADEMERLQVLGGVSEYPSRVKCATLAWHTLNNALDQKQEAARSE
jgi:nitrogen fixation NifU-like protein